MTDPAVELVLDHCRAMIREAGREEIPVLCILRDEIVKGVEASPRRGVDAGRHCHAGGRVQPADRRAWRRDSGDDALSPITVQIGYGSQQASERFQVKE